MFSNPIQAFAAYENGNLVRWGPASTGKKTTPTPLGLYFTNWKALETISTIDSTWIMKWYFNIDNLQGISMHEYELPGYPASHACLRLREEDAKWIYHWAEQWKLSPGGQTIEQYGTPIVIFGKYNFSKLPPWRNLPANPAALMLATDTIGKEISDYLPIIVKKQPAKDSAEFLRRSRPLGN